MNTLNYECPACKSKLEIRLAITSTRQPAKREQADTSGEDIGDLLSAINRDNLDERECDFYDKTMERYEKYKEKIILSDKQLKWLKDLSKKGF